MFRQSAGFTRSSSIGASLARQSPLSRLTYPPPAAMSPPSQLAPHPGEAAAASGNLSRRCGSGKQHNKQIGPDMSKRSSAKYKLDRRMGENVFGRPKSPVNKREYGPGQHGQRRKGKMSDFGIQLRAKQKLKGYYGDVTEKQFKKTFIEAIAMK